MFAGRQPTLRANPSDSGIHSAVADTDFAADLLSIPGIAEIHAETRGDERVCVAVLDGPVDLSHPILSGANVRRLEGMVSSDPDAGAATYHGTKVAGIIFGRGAGPSSGIAPDCRGLVLPIFENGGNQSIRACSQLDLARAITAAVLAGAQVINISGGQLAPGGEAHPLLADVVRDCVRRGVLIVAAVGNDSCECLHIPAALDSVLAVGAMDAHGEPLPFSNWGAAYQSRGILAPAGAFANPSSASSTESEGGTSFATAVVSGVVALLLSLQLRRGQVPDPYRVRDALLAGASASRSRPVRENIARDLAGPLNVRAAASLLTQGRRAMSEITEVQASDLPANRISGGNVSAPAKSHEHGSSAAVGNGESTRAVQENKPADKPAGCSCGGGGSSAAVSTGPSLIYTLGTVGYDFRSEARLDSFAQRLSTGHGPERSAPYNAGRFLAYLDQNPWEAAAVEWTLSLDGTPLYAIRPSGPFAVEGYSLLRRFLKEQLNEGVERISVPGFQAGKTTLLNGHTVPVLIPDLRGMYSWSTNALVDAVVGTAATSASDAERNGQEQQRSGVHNFLTRLYHELRNLGVTPQHRALNYAATNAFAVGEIFAATIRDKMELDHIEVTASPVCRPGSECWDVEIYFFYPERQVQTVRRVYRLTVDVSDTVPVTVGSLRTWFTR